MQILATTSPGGHQDDTLPGVEQALGVIPGSARGLGGTRKPYTVAEVTQKNLHSVTSFLPPPDPCARSFGEVDSTRLVTSEPEGRSIQPAVMYLHVPLPLLLSLLLHLSYLTHSVVIVLHVPAQSCILAPQKVFGFFCQQWL